MEKKSFGYRALLTICQQAMLILTLLCVYASDYFRSIGEASVANWLLWGALVPFAIMVGLLIVITISAAGSTGVKKIGVDIQLIALTLIVYGVLRLVLPIDSSYELADRLVAVAVIGYLLDSVFLIVYTSIISQIKGKVLLQSCVFYRVWLLIEEGLFRRTMFKRALRGFIAWGIGIAGALILCRYRNWIGALLIIFSGAIELYFSLRKAYEERLVREAIIEITGGRLDQTLDIDKFHGEQKVTALAVNHIRDGLDAAVKAGIKNERMKADLITNVSHDLKTPLTSIINYVNILKREIPESEQASNHIKVLDEKSQRLKTLLEDLVEVSRLTSGTVKYEMVRIDFVELLYEIGGEFDERFENRGLTIVTKLPRLPVNIEADGRQLCRAVENLYTNAAKYAKQDTHVNVELERKGDMAVFTIRNVMSQPMDGLQTDGTDLTERFVRGDVSRTTEGSGLGLSITKEIVTQMGGSFTVSVEDDIYVATITFKIP